MHPAPGPYTKRTDVELNDAKFAICPGKLKTLPLTPYNKILASTALCSRWGTAVGATGETVTGQKVDVGIGQNHDPLYRHSSPRSDSSPRSAVSATLAPTGANGDRAVCKNTSGKLRSQCTVDHLHKRLEKTRAEAAEIV